MLIYPNPYRSDRDPRARVVFARLPGGSSISIYTLTGFLVRTQTLELSQTQWEWNLENSQGSAVASGVYLIVVQSPGRTQQGKVVLLR